MPSNSAHFADAELFLRAGGKPRELLLRFIHQCLTDAQCKEVLDQAVEIRHANMQQQGPTNFVPVSSGEWLEVLVPEDMKNGCADCIPLIVRFKQGDCAILLEQDAFCFYEVKQVGTLAEVVRFYQEEWIWK